MIILFLPICVVQSMILYFIDWFDLQVFGPDDPILPEAWFKHATPHPMWGLFPRIAYKLFEMKQDGWVFRLKYFQNIVNTVRDLMAPDCKEESYKVISSHYIL